MRAILLAGGHATRLWPITKHRPKPLLPIGKGTLLDALCDQLEPLTSEVVVSTNALFAAQFERALAARSRTRLVVEAQRSEAEKPGALGALLQVLGEVQSDEPLLVVAGDNYYGFPLAGFVRAAARNGGPSVAAKELGDRRAAASFGVVELGTGTLIRAFHEKPRDPPSSLVATALYYYPTGWRALFEEYATAARASDNPRAMLDSPGRILEWAVGQGREVHAWVFREPWYDIGTPAGYFDALAGVLGPRYVEGRLDDCTEGAGVYVFGDARAERSRLERTILFPGALVEDSDLSRTIVDTGARIKGARLADRLVGPGEIVTGTTS